MNFSKGTPGEQSLPLTFKDDGEHIHNNLMKLGGSLSNVQQN
jgi:hypothetical protein